MSIREEESRVVVRVAEVVAGGRSQAAWPRMVATPTASEVCRGQHVGYDPVGGIG